MKQKIRFVFLSVATFIAIYLFVAMSAHGQKALSVDPTKITSTITNLDAVIQGSNGDDTTICVKIWRGRNLKGDIIPDGEHKYGELRSIHLFDDTNYVSLDGKRIQKWEDICVDESVHENLYQYQAQKWPMEKVKAFQTDKINRYIIEESDLTVLQRNRLKAAIKTTQALGNFRIKKELK